MGVSLTEPSHQASHSLSRVMSDGADWFETFRQYEKPSRNTREKRQRERHSSNSLSPKTVRTLHPAISSSIWKRQGRDSVFDTVCAGS